MNKSIYFDHAAATPLDEGAFQAMQPYFVQNFANPSSLYDPGRKNRFAIDKSRQQIADVLLCKTLEIFFTSGGTESNNWAVFGLANAYPAKKHIITTKIEHHSLLGPVEELERRGYEVTYLPVDTFGLINLQDLEKALRPDTLLVSIMYGNNEIGSVDDIPAIGRICRERKVLFHSDACQAAGFFSLDVEALKVDLLTLNSGKIYGPKGAGSLYVREGVLITPLLYGGGQEHRLRSGTENVAAIVGFGYAFAKAEVLRSQEVFRLVRLRERLWKGLLETIPGVILNGHPEKRLPNNLNICLPSMDAESLVVRLDMEGVYVSSGSACSSGSMEPSHVLLGIGKSKKEAKSSIRISLGRDSTEEEVESFLKILGEILDKYPV